VIDWRSLVAFFGVLFAVAMRSLLPYVRKIREASDRGEDVPIWSHRYTITGLSALLTGLVVTLLAFPTLTVPAEPTSLIYVFVVAFGYGWGLNDVYNKVLIDWR